MTHYNHTNNFHTILNCLRSKYIIKINRSEYNLTPEGLKHVKSLYIDNHYITIIQNTEKHLDILIKAALHPLG